MGTFRIVFHQPGIHRSAHLRQIPKRVGIQHFPSERTIEPFNISILSGLARLDPVQDHLLLSAPVLQVLTDELWTVVAPQSRWFPIPFYQLIQQTKHSPGRQRVVHFDTQHFPVIVINYVQGAELTPILKPSEVKSSDQQPLQAVALGKGWRTDSGNLFLIYAANSIPPTGIIV